LPCLSSQAFFEWCLTVAPGACSKTDPLPLGFFGTVFFGFLGSRPDRFCPFAIAASSRDYAWMMMMRPSQINWLVSEYLGQGTRNLVQGGCDVWHPRPMLDLIK
jgi:hypothetical protein